MLELTIELKTGSAKCLYEQIYEHIRKEIKEGKLPRREASLYTFVGGKFTGCQKYSGTGI